MKRLIILTLGVFLSFTTFAEKRNALLIANGKYKSFGNLATPVKEAKDLKKSLEKLGFTVTIVENGGKEKISDSLYDFQQKLEKSGGIGFFHYGGHAVQVNGKNYIIPVDADIPDERRVASRAVDVDEVMASMQADTNIIILDACRNNPLPASSGRSATRGLVLTEYKPKNSIIIYSAQPGKVAQDGIFTPILTEKLLEKKSLADVLMDVRRTVRSRTNNEQSPGEYNELESMVYLAGFADMNKNDVIQSNTEKGIDYVDLANKAYDEKDYKLAFEYFSKADKITDYFSQSNFAWLYQTGEGGFQNYAKAFEWYEKAAQQGFAFAQNKVGLFYDNGWCVPQSYKNAKVWYEKAAKQGEHDAQINLGFLYLYGYGVKQNLKKAHQWFEKSALQGDAIAQYNLGLMFYNAAQEAKNNEDAIKNIKSAKKWYEKSAAQGDQSAAEALRKVEDFEKKLFANIDSRKNENANKILSINEYIDLGNKANKQENYTDAFNYFQKAADMGNAYAQSWVGYFYRYGVGTKKNFTKALEYFEKAANQGDAYSCRNLAENYEYGFEVAVEDSEYGYAKNFDKAFYWYKKAAEQGDVEAQTWMGALYSITYHFFGIKQNIPEAKKWFKKAADQGDEFAKQQLKELN